MILNYFENDQEIEKRIQANTEYQYNKTKLTAKVDERNHGCVDLKVKTGIFRVVYRMQMDYGQMQVTQKFAPGKLLWLLTSVVVTLFALLLAYACAETYEPDFGISNLYILVIMVPAIIITWLFWYVYGDIYSLRPDEVLLRYFHGVIFRQEPLQTEMVVEGSDRVVYDIKHVRRDAEGRYTPWENKYTVENTTPSMQRRARLEKIFRTVGTIGPVCMVIFACFFMVPWGEGWNLLVGLAFLIKGLFAVAVLWLWKERDREISQYAMPYEATIVGVAYRGKSKRYVKVYEFKDNFGRWHRVRGVRGSVRKRGTNAEALIGTQTTIWYAPEYHTEVLESAVRPTAHIDVNEKLVKRVWAVLLVGCIFCMSAVEPFIQKLSRGPADPMAETLKIEWARDYVDTGLTQEDIESDTVQWMCSTYALRAEFDGGELYTIGVFEPTEYHQSKVKTYLKEAWGITDRASAIDTMNTLLEYGSRSGYKDFIEQMRDDGWFDMSGREVTERIESGEVDGMELRYRGAYDAYQRFGEIGIDAWDYCRLIRVAGLCYVAEYITLEECMDQSLAVAKYLQVEYDSWEDLNQSYIYGYMYWAKSGDTQETIIKIWGRTERQLMVLEDGPYSLDFDMKLEDTWN